MYSIFKDFSFAAAHAIRGHTRGCQNLHGHNYRVRVHLRARRLDALGMVLDFADLKAMVQEVLGPFDHHVLNEVPPFGERNTTAELLAQYVYDEVSKRLADAAPRDEADENVELAESNEGRRSPGASREAGSKGAGGEVEGRSEGGEGAVDASQMPGDTRQRIWVARVEVWENDTSCAAYEP
jgi:6-pyruvoyltetrahydropterin/6-carboxytetrahydropterin synthase